MEFAVPVFVLPARAHDPVRGTHAVSSNENIIEERW